MVQQRTYCIGFTLLFFNLVRVQSGRLIKTQSQAEKRADFSELMNNVRTGVIEDRETEN